MTWQQTPPQPPAAPQSEFVMWRPGMPLWQDSPPKRRRRGTSPGRIVLLLVTVLVFGGVVLLVGGAVDAGMTAAKDASTTGTPSHRSTTSSAGVGSVPASNGVGDGTFVVGSEIAAGTYRTAGPADAAMPNCYWARLSNTSGSLDAIVANGNSAGPTTVTISATDKAFETNGCQGWVRVR